MITKRSGFIARFCSLVAVAAMLLATDAVASKEGVLEWSSFTIDSEGIGSSGPVGISGKQDASGIKALTVKVFGRTYELSKEHLENLKAMLMNGMQLSYEGGYKNLGGRTLYIQMSHGFLSGVVVRKLISITERGDITVREWPAGAVQPGVGPDGRSPAAPARKSTP